jgi:ABC-2 type transport system ATP-binding protein
MYAREGPNAILVERLTKRFGRTAALDGVDLAVASGTVFGLLGPNGAGKTTLVRILTTLLRPDGGEARVAGFDVVREPDAVRRRIGLAGQQAAVDEFLSGRANLEMVGRLYHLGPEEARRRASELLERFSLEAAAGRLVKTYSGGMRRRLDLAASLVAAPPILFLDEPTTGLDPRSRADMWDVIEGLVAGGTTVLLTTQYLEEADRLAGTIAVIDRGHVVAQGSPDELKRSVGGERLDARLRDVRDAARAREVIGTALGCEVEAGDEPALLTVPVSSGTAALATVIRELDAAAIAIDDIALRRPTLDEVFLTLTGHGVAGAPEGTSAGMEEVS